MIAAAYAFGIVRHHPFADGNKQTARVMARLFLLLNGIEIAFSMDDAIATMLAVAAGEMPEETFAPWFRGAIVAASRKCPPGSLPAGILSSPGKSLAP